MKGTLPLLVFLLAFSLYICQTQNTISQVQLHATLSPSQRYELVVLQNQIRHFQSSLSQFLRANKIVPNHPHQSVEKVLNYQNQFYYGNMTIGTPPQQLRMLFDTGSALLWVPSSDCQGADICSNKIQFNASKSTTCVNLHANFTYAYSNWQTLGLLYQDTVRLAGISNENYVFGSVYGSTVDPNPVYDFQQIFSPTKHIPRTLLASEQPSQYDGIIGLGLPEVFGNISGTFTYMSSLIEKGLMAPSYSMFLSYQTEGSVLILGGIDMKYAAEPFHYFDVLIGQMGYWQMNLSGMKMNGKNAPYPNNSIVLFDTGNPGIAINQDTFNLVVNMTGLDQTTEFDCSLMKKFPVFEFQIGDQIYVQEPSDYILKQDGMCSSTLSPMPCINYFVSIGDNFLRKYYTHYDLGENRMGFALAKHQELNNYL